MKPKLSKPTLESWHTSEKLLKKIVDHLNNTHFNINAWKFHIPGQNKTVSYKEICDNIQERVPRMMWIEALQSWFKYLPADLERMKNNMNAVVTELAQKVEQQVNFIKQQDEYITKLESELERTNEKLNKIELNNREKRYAELEESIKSLKEEFKKEIRLEVSDVLSGVSIEPIRHAEAGPETYQAMQHLNNKVPQDKKTFRSTQDLQQTKQTQSEQNISDKELDETAKPKETRPPKRKLQ